MKRFIAIILGSIVCVACAEAQSASRDPEPREKPRRIVSLDYCADQYVLRLAEPQNILALSPDAGADFSYLRDEAKQYARLRPRAEDILVAQPGLVVRTYGGGPGVSEFLERAGVPVLQIGYADDLAAVRAITLETASKLGETEKGVALAAEIDDRLAAVNAKDAEASVPVRALYLSSKGAVAGGGTLMDDIFRAAGVENFLEENGWRSAPLERLAYEQPDLIVAGFFGTSDLVSDIWTPTRHPIVERQLKDAAVVNIPGAWTACGAWFNVDAVEAVAAAHETKRRKQ